MSLASEQGRGCFHSIRRISPPNWKSVGKDPSLKAEAFSAIIPRIFGKATGPLPPSACQRRTYWQKMYIFLLLSFCRYEKLAFGPIKHPCRSPVNSLPFLRKLIKIKDEKFCPPLSCLVLLHGGVLIELIFFLIRFNN